MDRTTRWGQSWKVISSRPGQKQSWKIAKNVCTEIMWLKKEKKVIHLTSTLEWQLIEKGPPYHARGADWGGGGRGGGYPQGVRNECYQVWMCSYDGAQDERGLKGYELCELCNKTLKYHLISPCKTIIWETNITNREKLWCSDCTLQIWIHLVLVQRRGVGGEGYNSNIV